MNRDNPSQTNGLEFFPTLESNEMFKYKLFILKLFIN
jgi:hypothetical protein